jgi:cytochrome P450
MTNLGAGVDTMSQTMAAVIAGVSLNAPVRDKLLAELDAATTSGRMGKGQPVSHEVASSLEYLQACIQEALRWAPNIATSLVRSVPAGGIVMDGYFIPESYTVGMSPRGLGRNESIFGPDTESFRPERWLEASKEQRSEMELFNLGFGGALPVLARIDASRLTCPPAGPSRKCPGMRLAQIVLGKVLATLFLNFDVKALNQLDGPPGPGGQSWTEIGGMPSPRMCTPIDSSYPLIRDSIPT